VADVGLPVAADTLARAADLIERLLVDYKPEQIPDHWVANSDQVNCVGGPDAIAETWTWREADLIAAFDPHTVAALVDPLHEAAAEVRHAVEVYGAERGLMETSAACQGLLEFARRLLREEEGTDG
jgi:hypothetical protein